MLGFFAALAFPQSPEAVLARLEKSLRSVQTLEARFIHTYFSAMVTTPLEEKGRLAFQKPDVMRWEYTEPEHNIYLYRGDRFEFYFPEDNQLMRGSISEESHESLILDLLTGKKNFAELYAASFNPFPTEHPENAQIKLTPLDQDQEGVSTILLEIDTNRWLIQRAVFVDWEGNKTEFAFSRIKINHPLPKGVFDLKLPPGVEIIERPPEKPFSSNPV